AVASEEGRLLAGPPRQSLRFHRPDDGRESIRRRRGVAGEPGLHGRRAGLLVREVELLRRPLPDALEPIRVRVALPEIDELVVADPYGVGRAQGLPLDPAPVHERAVPGLQVLDRPLPALARVQGRVDAA